MDSFVTEAYAAPKRRQLDFGRIASAAGAAAAGWADEACGQSAFSVVCAPAGTSEVRRCQHAAPPAGPSPL